MNKLFLKLIMQRMMVLAMEISSPMHFLAINLQGTVNPSCHLVKQTSINYALMMLSRVSYRFKISSQYFALDNSPSFFN